MHAEIKTRPHWWIAASATLLLGQVVLALTLKPGFVATALEDISMFLLILFATGVMARNALRNQGQVRVFWAFLAGSGCLWAISVWEWVYYEIIIRKSMPDDSAGDLALFIHIVPLMAAVLLRPDQPAGRRKLYLQTLNLLLLLLWWVFLYAYVVAPYQYLSRDANIYGLRYDMLYFLENLVFLGTLGTLLVRTKGPWKEIYLNLFVASSDRIHPEHERQLAAVFRIHGMPGIVLGRLGVEDQAVEIEDQRADHRSNCSQARANCLGSPWSSP